MTSRKPFSSVPAAAQIPPRPFTVEIEEQKVQDLKTLLRLSPIAKETYENVQDAGGHGEFGVSRQWIVDAKKYWEERYDWRKEEAHINTFPHFTSEITDPETSTTHTIHFVALFSKSPSAIPLAMFHGWPGSFLEFLPLLSLLRDRYTEDTLPYHIIVPSLPGYAFSSSPPLTRNWTVSESARVLNRLLVSLGFGETGYLAQGGDIGASIARDLAAKYPACRGMHLNFMEARGILEKARPDDELSETEKAGVERYTAFREVGRGYAIEHGTKPSTIGLVLSSSPVALLAWVGEKFLAWSDPNTTPTLDFILNDVTLYWLTNSFPSSIYPYRDVRELYYVDKPVGYSYFPWELGPIPRAWAERTGNMVSFKAHESGGHFAAVERTEALWADVEAYINLAWKGGA